MNMIDPSDLVGDTDDTDDDAVVLPLPLEVRAAVVTAMGGHETPAGVAFLPSPAARMAVLPLRLGDIDLGQWQLDQLTVRMRHRHTRFMLTIRRVADDG